MLGCSNIENLEINIDSEKLSQVLVADDLKEVKQVLSELEVSSGN